MEKINAGRIAVEHCGRCGATWLDAYELEAVLKAGAGAVAEIDFGTSQHGYTNKAYQPGTSHCPRDGELLIEIPDPRQPHVMIDLCRKCGGVLLDAGELKDLSEFTLAERVKALFHKGG